MDQRCGESAFSERRAIRPLRVIVIGAGIGGLAVGLCMRRTGHDVRILEKRQAITEIGAGIQLAPNASRILQRFGIFEEAMKYATVLEQNSSRRWDNDAELGSIPLVPNVEEQFGIPLGVIHRADLLNVLLEAALDCGCQLLTNHQAIDTDENFLPKTNETHRRILVRSNEIDTWMSADLIVAADGINSIIRKRMAAASGYIDTLGSVRESAYRFMLPLELVEKDETVMALLHKNHGMRYLGPGGHVMAYPLRNNTLYNVVLVRTYDCEKETQGSWTTPGDKEEMREHYRGWNPVVQALIQHAPDSEVLETPMNNMPPLPTWVKGQIALAGDACHFMLPYVAQGAANAIEDAATLAMAFTCTDNIELALDMYQQVRKSRSERIQASAKRTGYALHLPDGEEQRSRDESIRAVSQGSGGENPDQWNDRQSREYMWRVDVMAQTISRFESLVENLDKD
ncbi:putative salicylate hydroxylase [Xylaria sp. CBS 124048]|nr:putative salicylate hydroxylase [Xylaria sp. CBS 124048]